MLPARNTPAVAPRRPTSTPPLPPRALPKLAELPTEEESTAVVETPTFGPRKTPSGVRTLVGFAPLAKASQPPPLPSRRAITEPPAKPIPEIVTTEAFGEEEEYDRALERMFPMTLRARAFFIIAAAALFLVYASVAAARWAARTAPKVGARALAGTRALAAQARDRLRLEWARAAERARSTPSARQAPHR